MRMIRTNLSFAFILMAFSVASIFAQGDLERMRQLIFEKTNALRVEKGLPILERLDSLMDLAQFHSENMVKHGFYDHLDHLGLNPTQRAEKFKVKAYKVASTDNSNIPLLNYIAKKKKPMFISSAMS